MKRFAGIAAVGALLLIGGAGTAASQGTEQRIDRKMALDPDGNVRIYNFTGSVRVEAWKYDTLAISGTVSGGTTSRFFFGGTRRGAKMGVESPLDMDQPPAHLTIRVPARTRVSIKTTSASVVATGLSGGIDVTTMSGNVRFEGNPDQLTIETMDGNIDVNAVGTWIRTKTASGTITLRGAGENVAATTVSGGITLLSSGMRQARLESISGDLGFSGWLTRDGELTAESHSGGIDVLLPSDIVADFTLSSYHGTMRNEFRAVPPKSGTSIEQSFSTGDGGAEVNIKTFKGTILLRRK